MKSFFSKGIHSDKSLYVLPNNSIRLLKGVLLIGFILLNSNLFAQQRNCGDAIDYFRDLSYSNQNGDLLWTSDWIEGGDDGSSTSGFFTTIPSGYLSMKSENGVCRTIERSVDISDYSQAVLTLKYNSIGVMNGNDFFNLYVSIDGGNNFITLDNFDQTNLAEGFIFYDMTPYITPNTVVRMEVCGFQPASKSLDIEFFNVTGCNEEIITGPCSDGLFRWENISGGQQIWNANDQSNTYAIPYSGGTANVTVTLIDPDNRNSDSDVYDPANHPYDPAGGCLPYDPVAEQDNVAGDGTFTDPWDSDCGQLFTQTNGAYGPDYLTWVIYAENHTEEVTLEFCFDVPVLMTDFNISDIDWAAVTFSNNISEFETVGNSFQDEIKASAIDPYGNNVPVTFTALGSEVVINGQEAKANYDAGATVTGDLSPNDPNGEIVLNAEGVIECFYLTYSNGPDDAADEQANAALYDWWSATNGATNGVSDDQAVRIDGFNFCACPEFIISIANDTICEGELGTVLVQSVQGGIPPYTYLWDDGSTAAMYSDTPTTDQQVEVVLITDVQGCTDTANAVIYVEECCPPTSCLPVTITKNEE